MEKTKTLKFYCKHADSLSNEYMSFDSEWFQKILLRYLKKTDTILELGSAPGRDVKFLEDLGYDIKSVDFSKNMIWNAKKINGVKIRLENIKLLKPRVFNLIYSIAVLMHLNYNELEELFRTIFVSLSIPGLFIFSVPIGKKYGDSYVNKLDFIDYHRLVQDTGFNIKEMVSRKDSDNIIWETFVCSKF